MSGTRLVMERGLASKMGARILGFVCWRYSTTARVSHSALYVCPTASLSQFLYSADSPNLAQSPRYAWITGTRLAAAFVVFLARSGPSNAAYSSQLLGLTLRMVITRCESGSHALASVALPMILPELSTSQVSSSPRTMAYRPSGAQMIQSFGSQPPQSSRRPLHAATRNCPGIILDTVMGRTPFNLRDPWGQIVQPPTPTSTLVGWTRRVVTRSRSEERRVGKECRSRWS